jgi:LmbE family N-acetylglucosaminyl deacetylase
MKPKVLAIGAHPDDIEFTMAGTMLWLAEAGYELHYLNLARGNCGSTRTDGPTTSAIRRREAQQAAAAMGATFHESLVDDLEIFYEAPLLRRLAAIVRRIAPRVVLTHSPEDYMEDHTNACRLAVTAAFSRGMPNFAVDPPTDAVDLPLRVYHAQPHGNCDGLGRPVQPRIYVDVGRWMDRKTQLLGLHASQGAWLGESQHMDSYIGAMQELMQQVGALSGRFTHAEGWRRHGHLGFCAADDDPLTEAIAPLDCLWEVP